MTDENNFKMKANDVISVPGKGMVAFGGIESGVIRAGDEVQIFSFARLSQAKVTQVEIDYNVVEQAGAGEQIGLVFADLGNNDIEEGALIFQPGAEGLDESILSAPKEKVDYTTLPMRKRPPIRKGDYLAVGVNMGMGLVFVLITIITLAGGVDSPSQYLNLGWGILGLGVCIYTTPKLTRMIRQERVYKQGNANTTATILDKWTKTTRRGYFYYLAFEFEPMQANPNPGKLTLRGEVPDIVFRRVKVGGRIIVRYAKDDPEVIILVAEGVE